MQTGYKHLLLGIMLFMVLFLILPARETIQGPCDDPSCVGVSHRWLWFGGAAIVFKAYEDIRYGNVQTNSFFDYPVSFLSTGIGALVLTGLGITMLNRMKKKGFMTTADDPGSPKRFY